MVRVIKKDLNSVIFLDLLLSVDVMVLPSYYREGVPHSLIEALSVGLPIITTDMPGCRMVVKDQHNGFMIPPRNSNELLNAMELLMQQVLGQAK